MLFMPRDARALAGTLRRSTRLHSAPSHQEVPVPGAQALIPSRRLLEQTGHGRGSSGRLNSATALDISCDPAGRTAPAPLSDQRLHFAARRLARRAPRWRSG